MQTVICVFNQRADAERAMERLSRRGFDRELVHVQGNDDEGVSDTAAAGGSAGQPGFFHGLFSDLFGGQDSDDAGRYDEAVRRGHTVVVIDAADEQEVENMRAVITEMGGTIDVDDRAPERQPEGGSRPDREARTPPLTDATVSGDSTVMPIVQEELTVGKRARRTGGIRVIQRVTETPIREAIRLRREHAVVERRSADRAATEADLSTFREGEIEIRETSEEAVVSKTARVVEEVVVGKQVEEREETVSGTVRRNDVEIEPLEPQEERGHARR